MTQPLTHPTGGPTVPSGLLPPDLLANPFGEELGAITAEIKVWRERLLDYATDHPLEALMTFVLGSSLLFFQAEREANEAVDSFDDAVYYVSTCLSVGYANIFPVTPQGKFIAAVVMMLGPSLSTWVVEGRAQRKEREEQARVAPEIAALGDKLDAILVELKAQRSTPPAA